MHASTDDLMLALKEVYVRLDIEKVKTNPRKQRRLAMKASRLLDRVILHKWIETEPQHELPESLNLSDKYSHLSLQQIELIREHLRSEASFFMKGKYPTTIRSNNPVVIDVGDNAPRLSGYRRLNSEEQIVVDEYVAKLIEADVVEPCKSPWSSPILLVPKKDMEVYEQ